MKPITHLVCAAAALLAVTALPGTALADGKDYNDGPVINVAAIRTVDGHFDDYMHWLATTFKQEQEAAKKAGLILGYRVILVEPRGPNDPDVYLVTEYKNWAALDGMHEKMEALAQKIYGSTEIATQGAIERAKIRRALGGQTLQVLKLK